MSSKTLGAPVPLPSSPSRGKHNKSGDTELNVTTLDEDVFRTLLTRLKALKWRKLKYRPIRSSACRILKRPKSQRMSWAGKKVCYAYQLIARKRWGTRGASLCSSAKSEANAHSISHLCGQAYCLEKTHLVIEPKVVQEERAHCHFTYRRLYDSYLPIHGKKRVYGKVWKVMGVVCPHQPRCCTENDLDHNDLMAESER